MKVIHTYVTNDTLPKGRMYISLLSALYAKKHYGNIHLYANEIFAKQIMDLGVPYDSINTSLLNSIENVPYSLCKLLVYREMNEPFLHIDNDSIIYQKINFDSYDSPFLFSHQEFKNVTNVTGKLGDHLNLVLNNRNENSIDHNIYKLNFFYLELYQKLLHQKKIDVDIDINNIPNMSLLFIKDTETFSKCVGESLSYFNENKDEIKKNPMGAHHIEQLMIHLFLIENSSEYKEKIKNNQAFIYEGSPIYLMVDESNNRLPNHIFPISFVINTKCSHCGEYIQTIKYKINNLNDIKKFLGFQFNGYVHFSQLQDNPIFQTLVIDEIVNEFGVDYILKMNQLYGNKTVLESELLYDRITGNNFFSNPSLF